ncbi:MAG: VOC family protein, partial [Planctomycetes bacterium]|nr:VOC family protein [Planctomycetota bacterium]
FDAALRFWAQGLRLEVVEKETSAASAYALLESPAAGPAIHLFGGAEPWPEDTRPPDGTRPAIRLDVMTSDFDDTLVRLIESGGKQLGEIETYDQSRVVTVADPDGNTFELLEVPEEAEE